MPAYEIPGLRFSGESGGVIKRRRFVTINDKEQVIQVTANTQTVVGASSQPNEKAGEVAEVYDGIVMVEAGGAITSGATVMSDVDGKAVTYVEGVGVLKAGTAITTAGAAGELLSVKL